MLKTELPRVQHLAGKTPGELRRIDLVTQNGMAEMMQMDADLMRATAVQSTFDKARLFARLKHAILSSGGPSTRRSNRHPLSMHRVTPDFFVDDAAVLPGLPRGQSEIDLFDCSRRELRRERPVRFIVFRDNNAAARFFIETMHDAWPLLATDAGEIWAMMQQRVHERMLALASAWMDDKACRFVDDNQVFILEQNIERDRLRPIVNLHRRRLDKIDTIAGANEIARSRGRAI